jgi:DNA repair exonuclease SbcCD ATPase subunit
MNEELAKQFNRMINVTKGASLADLQELSQLFLSIVKELKTHIEKTITDNKEQADKNYNDVLYTLEETQNKLEKLITDARNSAQNALQTHVKEMYGEMSRIEACIPMMPEMPDMNEWSKQIIGKIKIPTMDEVGQALPKYAEQIRNGLELLGGDARLDKSAIRGLEDIEKQILELKQSVSSSVGLSGYYTPSGTIDGSNQTFNFVSIPNVIVVDGLMLRKTQADGTINWTGNEVIVLTVAPTYEIFSLA